MGKVILPGKYSCQPHLNTNAFAVFATTRMPGSVSTIIKTTTVPGEQVKVFQIKNSEQGIWETMHGGQCYLMLGECTIPFPRRRTKNWELDLSVTVFDESVFAQGTSLVVCKGKRKECFVYTGSVATDHKQGTSQVPLTCGATLKLINGWWHFFPSDPEELPIPNVEVWIYTPDKAK